MIASTAYHFLVCSTMYNLNHNDKKLEERRKRSFINENIKVALNTVRRQDSKLNMRVVRRQSIHFYDHPNTLVRSEVNTIALDQFNQRFIERVLLWFALWETFGFPFTPVGICTRCLINACCCRRCCCCRWGNDGLRF